ncbi:tetratricopeptide repeat protein [Streptomyces cynarae]|uniref:tetratricopeptide repeat protein n=1 Tax=Streptomyces cynarae TaxID=2981134 RepID=UPI00406C31EB
MADKAVEANQLMQAAFKKQSHNDLPGASRAYRRVLELDPHNKFAWYSLGTVAQQMSNTAEARVAYEKALKIDPSFMSALFSEAVLLKSSDPDRAVGLLKRAVADYPKAASVRMQLGLLLAENHRDDEAKEQFSRAVAANPSLLSGVPERFRDSVRPSPTSSSAGKTE